MEQSPSGVHVGRVEKAQVALLDDRSQNDVETWPGRQWSVCYVQATLSIEALVCDKEDRLVLLWAEKMSIDFSKRNLGLMRDGM
jgi:hypothetical protein